VEGAGSVTGGVLVVAEEGVEGAAAGEGTSFFA
jgi:hypothetical protein